MTSQSSTNTPETLPVLAEPPLVQLGTLQASTPTALVTGATAIADTLATLIRQKKLATNIQGKEYVRVEGWTVLGALLGVVAREESVEERADGSYLATVALVRMADNVVVSRASAECGMDEPRWANGPKYARRSMALTRATGKAARLAFSWIMTLAGFQPTPAEEMSHVVNEPPPNSDWKIAADASREIPPDCVPSGKHQGKKWEEVSADYLDYIVHDKGKKKASPTFKALCQKELDRRAEVFGHNGISEGSDIPFEPGANG